MILVTVTYYATKYKSGIDQPPASAKSFGSSKPSMCDEVVIPGLGMPC
jgi:hypothetical protein